MGMLFIQLGIIFAGLSVVLGAFAAHALKTRISGEMMAIFEVGVRYQMYHSLALILLGIAMFHMSHNWLQWSGWSFIGGTILFQEVYTFWHFPVLGLGVLSHQWEVSFFSLAGCSSRLVR